jgi:hypothetical protein
LFVIICFFLNILLQFNQGFTLKGIEFRNFYLFLYFSSFYFWLFMICKTKNMFKLFYYFENHIKEQSLNVFFQK